jgi:hypothetical protein
MKISKKFLLSTAAFLVIVSVFALVGNANQSAKAAFLSPFGFTRQINSSDVPKLGVVELKGTVDSIQTDSYTVSGLTFRFDTLTIISGAPVVGDSVEVKALLLPDLTRYALKIEKLDSMVTTPTFEFYGLVETMAAGLWTVSGEQVQVTVDTVIDTGIAAGALVEVKGIIVGGLMVADKIELKESMPGAVGSEVEIYGTIESISGMVYVIGGKTVNTDAMTEITGMLAVGGFVKVHATLNADGTYLAREIELMTAPAFGTGDDDDQGEDQDEDLDEDEDGEEIKVTGVLESMAAGLWVVDGVSFVVDSSTKIEGDPQIGDIVKVEANVQGDGTNLAHEIELEDDEYIGSGDVSKDSDEDSGSSGSDDDDHDDDDDRGDGDHDDDRDDDDDDDDDDSGSDGAGYNS